MKCASSLFLLSLIMGCTTLGSISPAKVVQKADDGRITLQYYTGSKLDDMYEENFKAGARDACEGHSYTVLEKARTPSTLEAAKMMLPSSAYYWVVKCN